MDALTNESRSRFQEVVKTREVQPFKPAATKGRNALVLRVVWWVCILIVAMSWLTQAGFKLYHGIGDGTIYSDWTASRVWLHVVWCGLEAGLGAWLLTGRNVRPALLGSIFLLGMLSGIILLEPHAKPCGCGAAQRMGDHAAVVAGMWWSVARNAVLLALAVFSVAGMDEDRVAAP